MLDQPTTSNYSIPDYVGLIFLRAKQSQVSFKIEASLRKMRDLRPIPSLSFCMQTFFQEVVTCILLSTPSPQMEFIVSLSIPLIKEISQEYTKMEWVIIVWISAWTIRAPQAREKRCFPSSEFRYQPVSNRLKLYSFHSPLFWKLGCPCS